MKRLRYSVLIASTITLNACSPSGTPLIDMCKKITQNLVGAVETWSDPGKSESNRHMFITFDYTTGSGDSGTVECNFPPTGDRDTGNEYRTSPRSVTLNGEEVGQKDLIRASFGASKEVLKETANETRKQTNELAADVKQSGAEMAVKAEELAQEAKAKAKELAGEASVIADEATQTASQLLDKAKVQAVKLAEQASDVAGAAGETARETAIEAARQVQEKLEN